MPESSEQLAEETRRYGQLQLLRMRAAQAASQVTAIAPEQNEMGKGTFIFFLILCVIGDLIDFFTAGTIGWVTGIVIDFILLIGLGFSKKKRDQMYKILVGLGLETVLPAINMLPFRTGFLLWARYASQRKAAGPSAMPTTSLPAPGMPEGGKSGTMKK